MSDRHDNRRGAAILLLIAAFSLLLTFAFLAPRPDAVVDGHLSAPTAHCDRSANRDPPANSNTTAPDSDH